MNIEDPEFNDNCLHCHIARAVQKVIDDPKWKGHLEKDHGYSLIVSMAAITGESVNAVHAAHGVDKVQMVLTALDWLSNESDVPLIGMGIDQSAPNPDNLQNAPSTRLKQ